MRQFTWKKKFFSSNYIIYSNDSECGLFRTRTFSRKSSGEINETAVEFITTGFFKTSTSIIRASSEEVIGNITFSEWKTRALITLAGVEYIWKYDDFWHSKWSIRKNENVLISFDSRFYKGFISAEVYDPVLILASFLIREHFTQRHASAAAAS